MSRNAVAFMTVVAIGLAGCALVATVVTLPRVVGQESPISFCLRAAANQNTLHKDEMRDACIRQEKQEAGR